ncbi:MAG TPA: acyl-CoA dehydrogenase family protein [Candidatus Udaeobacter sp.]|nr:acyl-CoA dehydrogenase family protein [Candidatus Udaeobacter sp.]
MPTTTTAPTATKTTASPATAKGAKPRKPLPAPNSDFYYLYETLPAEELAIVKRVREFMETKVAPVITDYWVRDEFPFDLLPAVKELGIGGVEARERGIRAAYDRRRPRKRSWPSWRNVSRTSRERTKSNRSARLKINS